MSDRAKAIREQVSCLEACEMLGIVVETSDKICCFLHDEDTPSLHVYEDHWFCYGCGEKGDVIDLVQQYAGVSFGKACQFLEGAVDELATEPRVRRSAAREVVDLTERFQLEPVGNHEALTMAQRLVDTRWPSLTLADLQHTWGVKVCQHALWIPHLDPERRIVGIKTRSLYTGDKLAVKGSTYPQLYALGAHADQPAVLCEGESDTWTMSKAAPTHAVYGLPSGAKTWRPAYGEQLGRHRTVYLALDTDTTGSDAAGAVVRRLRNDHEYRGRILPVRVPGGDVADAIKNGWDPRSELGG